MEKLTWRSTRPARKNNFLDSSCTVGDANIVYTALSNGSGSFTLSSPQNYGGSGWADYPFLSDLSGDINGDRRTDLVWTSSYQSAPKTNDNLVVVGLANPDGTFQLGSIQNLGRAWTGGLSLADLNQDGKADLLWNNPPFGNMDVDTYAAVTSNGNGTFNNLGPGSVTTGLSYFNQPETNAAVHIPTSLVLVSTRQNAISNAFFVINGLLLNKTYLPAVRK